MLRTQCELVRTEQSTRGRWRAHAFTIFIAININSHERHSTGIAEKLSRILVYCRIAATTTNTATALGLRTQSESRSFDSFSVIFVHTIHLEACLVSLVLVDFFPLAPHPLVPSCRHLFPSSALAEHRPTRRRQTGKIETLPIECDAAINSFSAALFASPPIARWRLTDAKTYVVHMLRVRAGECVENQNDIYIAKSLVESNKLIWSTIHFIEVFCGKRGIAMNDWAYVAGTRDCAAEKIHMERLLEHWTGWKRRISHNLATSVTTAELPGKEMRKKYLFDVNMHDSRWMSACGLWRLAKGRLLLTAPSFFWIDVLPCAHAEWLNGLSICELRYKNMTFTLREMFENTLWILLNDLLLIEMRRRSFILPIFQNVL